MLLVYSRPCWIYSLTFTCIQCSLCSTITSNSSVMWPENWREDIEGSVTEERKYVSCELVEKIMIGENEEI